jgi:Vitamin K epoxide reductase family
MAAFALVPLGISSETQKKLKQQIENTTWWLLLAGSIAMVVFSGYLMYILATELKTLCPYCIGSATFSLSLLILTLTGRDWEDLGQMMFTGVIVSLLTIVATLGIYSGINGDALANEIVDPADGKIAIVEPQGPYVAPYGWEITSISGDAEIALAKHLTDLGVKEYGAYWCPHCYEQKQLFGKEAFAELNYIECAPEGKNPQPDVCTAAKIQSFPTWEINGKLEPGIKTPEELAKITNYQGNKDFKYKL